MDDTLADLLTDEQVDAALTFVAYLVDTGAIDDLAGDLTPAQVALAELVHLHWSQLQDND